MDHPRRESIGLGLVVVAIVVIAINQGVVIADVGVVDWLEGDGRSQSEWEVRAAITVISLLAALVVCLLFRLSESFVVFWKDRRLLRAVRKGGRRSTRSDRS